MATLPANRTKLALAQANQVAGNTADASANINALVESYDTIDQLNQKVDALVSASILSGYPTAIYRQAAINSGCEVAQRIAALGSLTLASGASAYVVDRIKSFNNGSGVNATASQVAISDLDGAGYALKLVHAATPSAQGKLAHTYTIEARDSYKFGGQQVVFAVKVQGVGGMNQATINARYKTSESALTNAATLIGTSGPVTISSTGYTVVLVVVTVPTRATLLTTGVIGFEIVASKTTSESSGDGFVITEIEIIKSNADLGFQPRSFAEELALCQRYYFKSFETAANVGSVASIAGGTFILSGVRFPVVMRTVPSCLISHNGAVNEVRRTSDNAPITFTGTTYNGTNRGLTYITTSGSPFVAGISYDFDITADAEL